VNKSIKEEIPRYDLKVSQYKLEDKTVRNFSAVNGGRKQENIEMLEFWASSKRRVVAQFQKTFVLRSLKN
jgi:hypothetical protein